MLTSRLLACGAVLVLAACGNLSHTNVSLDPDDPQPGIAFYRAPETPKQPRATFAVDGKRGNPDVLFFLAMSGGGSRAAYLSSATMFRLQSVFQKDGVDLLREVDVLSSVSGGSLAAAYYAISRDESLPLDGPLKALHGLRDGALRERLKVDPSSGTVRCLAPLSEAEAAGLRDSLSGESRRAAEWIVDLCAQAPFTHLRPWAKEEALSKMRKNYLGLWLGNWFWPNNIFLYWFTAYDRADIMAKTFEDNLFDTPTVGRPHTFDDLNPRRPYLIINATNATEQAMRPPLPDEFPFGTVFTFTRDDFTARLHSNVAAYSVARAVMASSAFPLVFPSMTLRDYRHNPLDECKNGPIPEKDVCDARYLHVFDGGNSDNLGLKSIKRALFELEIRNELDSYKRVVVILVDAFTKPQGAKRTGADPRSLLSMIIDTNLVDAVDSLLQWNRANLIDEFDEGTFRWKRDCAPATRSLPRSLCDALAARPKLADALDIGEKLVFYHLTFDRIEDPQLKARVDGIPTSFKLSDEHAAEIERAVEVILKQDNRCLGWLKAIVTGENAPEELTTRDCGGRRKAKPPHDDTPQTTR